MKNYDLGNKKSNGLKDSNKLVDESRNINQFIEFPPAKMVLYRCYGILTDEYFSNEQELLEYVKKVRQFDNITNFEISVLEFLGEVAGRCDVIRKTVIGKIQRGNIIKNNLEDRKSVMLAVSDTYGYSIYNESESVHTGNFVWKYQYGNLKSIYKAFKEYGIELKDDIYGREEQIYKSLRKI